MPFKLFLVAALALYAAGARADQPALTVNDTGTSMFSFSGFGTLGLVRSSERNADFTATAFHPSGAGHTSAWSADVDSRIAGQITANFTPEFSAVLQMVAEQGRDNSYRPRVEWANIKYQFTPDFSVRLGRTVLPVFLMAETRKVGYVYPWVRPPLEVYRLLSVTASEGLDVSYRLHLGEVTHTVQAGVGRTNVDLPHNGGTAVARDAWGIGNTTEYGPLTISASYRHTALTIDSVNALFDAFRQFGPEGVAIADKYDARAKPFSIFALGVSYDPGKWFVMAEWSRANSQTFIGRNTGWYASGGYRIGKFTPYVTYARARTNNLSDPGLNTGALPPFLVGPATGLNGALNAILSTKAVQSTISVGTRWDFMKNTALKVQFDHTRIGAGSSGTLTNLQPGFQKGGNVNLLSATIDFVF